MCYTISLTAVLLLNGFKKVKKIENRHLDRLNLLLLGGTIMLIVDHWWNNELFLIGPNIFKDLLLGVAMTGAILVFWGITVLIDKKQRLKAF